MNFSRVVIHVEPRIGWQRTLTPKIAEGLRSIGVPYAITQSRTRVGDGLPILLGTNCWRGIEADGPFLLVDRCSFGDPAHWVSLVFGGHGRRGDHRVPDVRDGSRWERYGVDVQPWRTTGDRTVLCGQTETYSPAYATLDVWYAAVAPSCTHFRAHPSAMEPQAGSCPTSHLVRTRSWDECRLAVTLNSSVAIDTVLAGIPTVTMDLGAMAWSVTGHDPGEIVMPDRTEWLHWLAWTQWTSDEIREGSPWKRFL